VVLVPTDLEGHEVGKVATRGLLPLREDVAGGAHHPQIDVLRGAGALEAKLEDEAALERRGVAHGGGDAGKEAVEHEQLPLASEFGAAPGGRSESLLECLLEGLRGGSVTRFSLKTFGAVRPPAFTKWTATSTSRSCGFRDLLCSAKRMETRPPIATRRGSKRTCSIEMEGFFP